MLRVGERERDDLRAGAREQEAPAASVPPVRLTEEDPAAAVAVPVHVVVSPLGVATTRPVGSVSVNATPVRAIAFNAVLLMVKLNEVLPFSGIDVAPKLLLMEGGAPTDRLAVAVLPVPPLVELTLPVVLVYWPDDAPVTFTENVQEPLAAMLAPERLITLVPWVAVIVPPPQLPLKPLGVEISSPAGSVSLKPTPFSAVAVLAF